METKVIVHATPVAELWSFRPKGTAPHERTAVCMAQRYGTGPDAVLILYGIQGEGYFDGLLENFDELTAGCRYVMGYVFPRHVAIYRRKLRSKARIEVHSIGKPYGEDGPDMAWIIGDCQYLAPADDAEMEAAA